MNAYNIFVVDDRLEEVSKTYETLLDGCEDFSWSGTSDPKEFEITNFRLYHAVILDINLNKGKWLHSLQETINKIGSNSPIILASAEFDEERTFKEIDRVLADRIDVSIILTIELDRLDLEKNSGYVKNIRQQLRLALKQYHKRATLTVNESETINILHVSDPQFGDEGQEAFMPEAEIGEYIDRFGIDIHFVTITGDISYSGLPNQFSEAVEAIDDLCRFVWGGSGIRERLLIVPGNHDVNLRMLSADYFKYNFTGADFEPEEDGIEQHQKFSLYPFREFAYEITKDRRWIESEELCWANESFLHLGLRFYHLNSVHKICKADASVASFPNRELKNILRAKPWMDNKVFGIALSHHGPRDAADSSVVSLSNWDDIKQIIKTSDIKLFIHGHGHRRLAQKLDPWPETENVVRVMAPTTHLNGINRYQNEPRGFNIIRLLREEGQVDKVEVDPIRLDGDKAAKIRKKPYIFEIHNE